MQIRHEQIDEMSQARRTESFRRLRDELRQLSPVATSHLDDTSLLAVIEQAAVKAETYGLKSGNATTAFIKLAVFAGISFDQHPSVRPFLQASELDPDYKVMLLAQLAARAVQDGLPG